MGIRPFFAIRHGETEWNRSGRFQGHGDAPLTEKGRAQVAECATLLEALGDRLSMASGSVRIYSSPLRRAAESAEILRRALAVQEAAVTFDDRLRETSFGAWEGMTTHEVKAAFPAERRMRKMDRWEFAPPGGESIAVAAKATMEFLAELPSASIPLLVSHSGNIRSLYHMLAGIDRANALLMEIPHVSVFHWDGLSFRRYDPAG